MSRPERPTRDEVYEQFQNAADLKARRLEETHDEINQLRSLLAAMIPALDEAIDYGESGDYPGPGHFDDHRALIQRATTHLQSSTREGS